MSENKLGKLEEVGLRKIWPLEAQDFSEWLASEEGLNLLSETIKVNFSSTEREEKIGNFFCDILGVETATNKKIVIENQLEKTNHKHLGQIITYAAGSDASIVIWIFNEIQEEHRQAIDWLNDITNENISFFALEIKLYRIGDSKPAPKFELICKPNIFGKVSRRPTEIQGKQKEFWTEFKIYVDKKEEKDFTQGAAPRNWYEISAKLPNSIRIRLYVNTRDKEIRCELQILSAQAIYVHLMKHKEDIDSKLGQADWSEIEDEQRKIILRQSGFDIDSESKYESYFDWFIKNVKLLKETLLPYIEKYENNVLSDDKE